ncbi:MAG: hypothetical protein CBC35_08280 [Planctomycetes bacterium TMED75]|nr:hypothetical protein [Planctomycetaceae bacterium]OUU91987.1 MAG: hypothetical protein CBC35_08280 [Planctomycetes bacterium TMED75]
MILVFGLAFSVIFHAAVLLPVLIDVANNDSPERFVELVSAIEPPAPEPEAEEPELGIEESMAKTMNWIGYEEYEEHLARLGETDQAEFIMQPSGGGGAPPPTPPSPQVTPPTEAAQPTPADQSEKIESAKPSLAEPTPPTEQAQIPEAALKPDAEQIETQTAEKTNPDATEGKKPDERAPKDGESETKEEKTEQPKPDAPKPEEPAKEPQEQEPQETPPTNPTPPDPKPEADPGKGPGTGEGDSGESGDAADKESDATSIVDVPPDLWKRGKPVAAQGVELQTKRPVINTLTQISARFGNPVVEIRFNAKGRPVQARILVSSGDRRLDEPILDSLYRWRAKGEKLAALKGDETFDVKLRFVLR